MQFFGVKPRSTSNKTKRRYYSLQNRERSTERKLKREEESKRRERKERRKREVGSKIAEQRKRKKKTLPFCSNLSTVVGAREGRSDGSSSEGSLDGDDGGPETSSHDEHSYADHSDGVGVKELRRIVQRRSTGQRGKAKSDAPKERRRGTDLVAERGSLRVDFVIVEPHDSKDGDTEEGSKDGSDQSDEVVEEGDDLRGKKNEDDTNESQLCEFLKKRK